MPASVNSRAVAMLRYSRCNVVILVATTEWLGLSLGASIVCGFDSYTVLLKWTQRKFEAYGIPIKSVHDTGTEGQDQPLSCSHQIHHVTSSIPQHDQTCTAVYWCRRQPFSNIFYDGISFQHLATVLISLFMLCYGLGILFRGPSCIIRQLRIFL